MMTDDDILASLIADELVEFCTIGGNPPSPPNIAHCVGLACARVNRLPDDAERMLAAVSIEIKQRLAVATALASATSV